MTTLKKQQSKQMEVKKKVTKNKGDRNPKSGKEDLNEFYVITEEEDEGKSGKSTRSKKNE